MTKHRFFTMIIIALSIVIAKSTHADVVNIDANSSSYESPVTCFFEAGTYLVTPIGIDDGGVYNAWNNHYTSGAWLNRYGFYCDEFEIYIDDGMAYDTELEALANAQSSQFTITSDSNVNFYIFDLPGMYQDNIGGMSVEVTPVPEPISFLLFPFGALLFKFFHKGVS